MRHRSSVEERTNRTMLKKLGEILVDAGLIDRRQLEIALGEQRKSGEKLGPVLEALGFTTEDAVSRALARQSGVEHWDLEVAAIDAQVSKLLPESVARRLNALPLRAEDSSVLVAMSNPTDILAIDEIQRRTDAYVRVVSVSHRQLMRVIDRVFGGEESSASSLERLIETAREEVEDEAAGEVRGAVISLVDEILRLGARREATDIHLQPDKGVLRVRLRIDGDLVQGPALPRELLASVVARVKIISDLDVSETRLPQDGKIRFAFEGNALDMRVSTFPTIFGESVVVRILDKNRQAFSLQSLGLEPREVAKLRKMVARQNGLLLAVGPTGAGKSTTLYALLRATNASRRKIITLEDPVEYELPLVTQCQVREKAGLHFASGLRSILRHDPDVVLVGEMRDVETARLGLRAALTGHLVLSTLHTNDAVGTISRLIDMGLDRFIIASCLMAVAAQRLVRRICPHCRYEYEPSREDLEAVGLPPETTGRFADGRGCERCHGTGHLGREAIFELLEVTPEVARLISRGAHEDEIEEAARDAGMVLFRESAQQRARTGGISLHEMARVTTES
jgi:type IV pilus assembly protein PilB